VLELEQRSLGAVGDSVGTMQGVPLAVAGEGSTEGSVRVVSGPKGTGQGLEPEGARPGAVRLL
jgi:hypothetical protein